MSKDHKEKANGTSSEQDTPLTDEAKMFDFDKSNPDADQIEDQPVGDEKVAELQATVRELKDKHLRLLAEFDNYKKRTMRERIEMLNSASKDVMVSLIPVLDDFDRAKKSAEDPANAEVFSDGVLLVYNRLYNILQGQGLKPMTSTGEKFDAELHEAITEIPAPTEDQKGTAMDTLEKGYMLHDKIIRHAKVVVGK